MIKIYDSADYNLTACLVNVQPKKAIIYKDKDGEYFAELEIPLKYTSDSGRTELYSPMLRNDYVAVIDTQWGKQQFRISNPKVSPRGIYSKAQHIYNDLKGYSIPQLYTELYSLSGAVHDAFDMGGVPSYFTYEVDSIHAGELYMVTYSLNDDENDTTTVYNALHTIAKMWGVQIVVNNRHILFRDYPSAVNSDVILRNAKNIDDITITENWDNVCTKCVAVGYRNLRAVYAIPSDPYMRRYDRVVQFEPSQNIDVNSDSAVITDLQTQAQAYVEAHINPEINYIVRATPDVNVDIGDPVIIKYSELVHLTATISSITYDALTNKYVQVEFGNLKPSIKGYKTKIEKQLKSLKLRIGQGGL
jgi:phage-related protein